ncbi:MAG: phosphate acetyltransferase [Eggerthellaceae bacterium]|nr:phosphate acetyltransferase [Eggerthellaceae bacterium]
MSVLLDSMIAKAKADKQTIVLPEGEDKRTLEAAEEILKKGIANLVILGNEAKIKASGFDLEGSQIIDNTTSKLREDLANTLFELRKHKGMSEKVAMKLMDEGPYFGVMLLYKKMADGLVSGACHSTRDILSPSLRILKTSPGAKLVSSYFLMEVPNCEYGEDGVFVFADCGLNVSQNPEKLANIAHQSAASFMSITGKEPRVAMLSHSSYGSAKNDAASVMVEATKLAKEIDSSIALDGELQLDAAIVPEIAVAKAPGSPVAGKANVLIFPNLDAGNIGYKLVQRLAKAEAFGPITQGLARPVNDLSRGCSARDIVGVVAITAVQCQNYE